MDTEISPNSNATPPQGLNTHHPHEYQNGFGGNNINQRLMQNGSALQPKAKGISHVMNRVHQQDILLSHEVSSNMLPIAGRKRCREEVEDEPEEWKRVRRLETGGGDCPIQPQGQSVIAPPTSVNQPITAGGVHMMMDNDEALEQTSSLTINNNRQRITNHQISAPIVFDADVSGQFYCSHKFKNSPCI